MQRAVTALVVLLLGTGTADAFERTAIRIAEGVYVLRADTPVADEDGPQPANITFVVGPRGVAVIDTGISHRDGIDILRSVRRVTPRPVRLAILTHPGQEAIFGAAAFQARGIPVLMHRDAAALMAQRCANCLEQLKSILGEEAMSGTRVAEPDLLVDADTAIDTIGRRLRLIAPRHASAPGALAVLDERTATLIAGNLVAIRAVPDLRDGDPEGWRAAMALLAATRCRHLVASFGVPGRCSGIKPFARYFNDIDTCVGAELQRGTSLAELGDRCAMADYSRWSRYGSLHRANVQRTYLRLERALFGAS